MTQPKPTADSNTVKVVIFLKTSSLVAFCYTQYALTVGAAPLYLNYVCTLCGISSSALPKLYMLPALSFTQCSSNVLGKFLRDLYN